MTSSRFSGHSLSMRFMGAKQQPEDMIAMGNERDHVHSCDNGGSAKSPGDDDFRALVMQSQRSTMMFQQESRLYARQNAEMFKQMSNQMTSFDDRLTVTEADVGGVKRSIDQILNEEIPEIKKAFNASRSEDKRASFRDGNGGDRQRLFPFLHLLFDPQSGNNSWVPVCITDSMARERDVVVLCLPSIFRFCAQECPYPTSSDVAQSSILNMTLFPVSAGLTYEDMIKAYIQSGFAFRSVGEKWANNRIINNRFRIVDAVDFKATLDKIGTHFDDRPQVRNFLGGRKVPNYKSEGMLLGYKNGINKSTGWIPQIRQTISWDVKKTLPVLGQEWVTTWYTPSIGRFFDIPPALLGKHHIVQGVLDMSTTVKSYIKGHAGYHKRQKKQQRKKGAGQRRKLHSDRCD